MRCELSTTSNLSLFLASLQGLKCFDDKFRDELVCPLCDTVLPKDGTQKINLRPNDDDVQKACHGAISKAGMEPQQLCAVLESGLEFWAAQQRNEASIHKASLENLKEELEQVKKLNRNLSMVSSVTP